VISFVVVIAAFAFGAADQYVGSLGGHGVAWAAQVSLLSAPWLVLAFLAGCTQRAPRPAAVLGLGATLAALLGYLLMTLSPIEQATLSIRGVEGFVRSDPFVFLGGAFTGPLFGWFGQQWRVQRAWAGALVSAAMVCLEPAIRDLAGQAITSRRVALAEVGAGLALAAYFAVAARRWRLAEQRG